MTDQIFNVVSISTDLSEQSTRCPPSNMLCGSASWVALLLCACTAMLGPMGHPVDNVPAAAPQVPQVLQGQMMQSPAANPFATKVSPRI